MRTEITKERAIKDLRGLFNISDKEFINAYETKGRFGINKQFMERFDVIDKLQEYFVDKMLEKGLGLVVGNITFIYTNFEIKTI